MAANSVSNKSNSPDLNNEQNGPMSLNNILFCSLLLILTVFGAAWATMGYVNLFVHKLDFVTITPVILIALLCPGFFVFGMLEAFIRNVKKQKVDVDKYHKPIKMYLGLCVLAIISAPLLIGPVMGYYMRSHGYEKCRSTQTGLTHILSPNWAKPSVGCEVWDLDYKERDALRERAKQGAGP